VTKAKAKTLKTPKRRPRTRKPAVKHVPSSAKMQALVQAFVERISTPDRPQIVGCLVVLSWRTPEQVHTQSAMFATDDSIGAIMMTTVAGHEIDESCLPEGHVGHA